MLCGIESSYFPYAVPFIPAQGIVWVRDVLDGTKPDIMEAKKVLPAKPHASRCGRRGGGVPKNLRLWEVRGQREIELGSTGNGELAAPAPPT